jgi:hypothetical protein
VAAVYAGPVGVVAIPEGFADRSARSIATQVAAASEIQAGSRYTINTGREVILKASDTVSEAETGTPRKPQAHSGSPQWLSDRVLWAIYGLALAISILTWFIAIRSPLWLDETISFFQINGRFSEIMARQGWPAVPVYSYFLWPWAKVMGTSEVALRIPSVLAMLGAVYLLYLAARQLFDRDVALIAAVVFCLHPVILSASIDVRPYAFGALAITASILALFHLRHNDSNWLAFLFGLLAASIAYFQFLFVVMLPALALCFVVLKIGNRKTLWRQLAVALVAFAIAFVPVIPGMEYMFHTSGTHVFSEAPRLAELGQTMASKRTLLILAAVLLLAAATRRLDLKNIAGQRISLRGVGAYPDSDSLRGQRGNVCACICLPLPASRGSGSRALLGLHREPDSFPSVTFAVLRGRRAGYCLPRLPRAIFEGPRFLYLEICPRLC